MQADDFYSVDEAARILKLTFGRIRQMLRGGELEGIPLEPTRGEQRALGMVTMPSPRRRRRVLLFESPTTHWE